MHERYRQTTDDRQTDGRQHIANVNVTFAKNHLTQRTTQVSYAYIHAANEPAENRSNAAEVMDWQNYIR